MTLPPELRIRSLGRSGKCSPPLEARNCSRKLPDFMFGDGSELPSRSRNYYYVCRRTREEGEEMFQKPPVAGNMITRRG